MSEKKDQWLEQFGDFTKFPVGSRVRVVSGADFFFMTGQTGMVVKNSGKYLGIRVQFDETFVNSDYESKKDSHGYNPVNLERLAGDPNELIEWVKAEINEREEHEADPYNQNGGGSDWPCVNFELKLLRTFLEKLEAL